MATSNDTELKEYIVNYVESDELADELAESGAFEEGQFVYTPDDEDEDEIETKGYLSFATMESTTTLRGAEEFIFGEYDFESTGKPAMFEGIVPVAAMTGAMVFSFYVDGVLQDSFQFFNMTGQFKFNQQKTLTKGTHRIKFTSRSASSADTYKLGQWSVALFRVIEL